MGKDILLFENSAEAFLRLGGSDDLTVFTQDLKDATTGIGDKAGQLQVIDEAERRVRKIAEGASNDADDRVKVLLDTVARIRSEVDGG